MRLACLLAAAVAILASAGCGAETSSTDERADLAPLQLPEGVVADVDGATLTGSELAEYLAEVEASYDAQGRPYPEETSPEYRNLVAEAIETLVDERRNEFLAAELGVVVGDEQVDAIVERTQRFNPDAEQQLEQAAVSTDRYRAAVRAQLVRHEIFKAAVAEATPTEEELRAAYEAGKRLVSFEEARDGILLELGWEKQAAAMKAWKESSETRLVAATTYADGWDPQELRTAVAFPVPPKQRDFGECDLPDGEYPYEELVEQGCAGDFPIPGRDGPACSVELVEIPLIGGFWPEEVESGYSEYLASTAGSCVPDPRGSSMGFFTDMGRPPTSTGG